MTLKIEITADGARTTLRLVGRIQAEHLNEVRAQIRRCQEPVILDLAQVTLVDVDAVRFLGACESRGVDVIHCSPYIREWIAREQDAAR